MIDFAKKYAEMVQSGLISIDSVPEKFRDAVRKYIG